MKSNKKIIIGVVIGIAFLAAIILIFILTQKESYRIVKIYEFDGTATVTRKDTGEIDMYPNMVLQSGDEVYLQKGILTLKLDEDKYVYVEEQTRFRLEAAGNATSGKTSIHPLEGAITNDIQSPLASDASYEVHTQNSSMSVRGTVFRVEIYYDEEGTLYTRVSVFDGKVETQLVYKDGTKGEPRYIESGKETVIFEDEVNTDYLEGITDIKYESLAKEALKTLKGLVEKEGLTLNISEDELDMLISGKGFEEDLDDDQSEEPEEKEEEEPEEKEEEEPENSNLDEDSEEDSDDEGGENEQQSGESSEQTNKVTLPKASEATYTVTFICDGVEFATQTVPSGGLASEPKLMPAATGTWDFSIPIKADTKIYWK